MPHLAEVSKIPELQLLTCTCAKKKERERKGGGYRDELLEAVDVSDLRLEDLLRNLLPQRILYAPC